MSLRSLLIGFTVFTMASALSAQRLERFAFGSCAHEARPQPIWETVVAAEPQLFIWAGDNAYLDTPDLEIMREKYAKLGAQPGYQQLLATGIPILATWDDHDFGVNDGGADFAQKADAQKAFLEFFDIPVDDPRHSREGIYHVEYFGEGDERVQVILLDTRYFRSPLEWYDPLEPGARSPGYRPLGRDRDAPDRTLLGEAQWAWLEGVLQEPARVRFIVTSIQFVAAEHRFEKWANLAEDRSRMVRLLRETQAEGVMFLSGDRHQAELSRWDVDGLYPLYDLTASGLNQSRPTPVDRPRKPEQNRYRIGHVIRGHHFGEVAIDWEQPDPIISLQIVMQDGSSPLATEIPLSALTIGDKAVPSRAMESSTSYLARAEDKEIDGQTTDWEAGHMIAADGEHLYVRLYPGSLRTLRRHAEALHVAFDLDNDRLTGMTRPFGDGYELEIVPGAEPPPNNRWRGPLITVADAEGETRELLPADIDLHIAPTHAADHFEMRFDRDDLLADLPAMLTGGEIAVSVAVRHKETDAVRELFRDTVTLPPAMPMPDLKAATLPAKPEGALRIMLQNVLWGVPLQNPAPFARIIEATQPDLYLLQEWDRRRFHEGELEAWFAQHVDPEADWDAVITGDMGFGAGTVVVAPQTLVAKSKRVTPVSGGGWDFPGRLAAAVVEAPLGTVLAASLHLKAGGSYPSPEDERRYAEAEAFNQRLVGMKAVARPAMVLVGGDYNMNGLTQIMDTLGRQLDLDDSALAVAQPHILGEPGLFYTHGRSGAKNRLDYLMYSETSTDVLNAFVLDTTRLDEASLKAMGLERADSHASDHLPLFFDVALRPTVDTEVSFP